MVPPPVIRTLECLQEKPRESTRSKSRESTRRGRQPTSDRTTQRIEMQGQVNSKSLQVPLQRRSEGAAIQQRPGAPTSSTTLAFGLLTMSALLLWLVLQPSQGATSGTLALWTAFTPAQAVAAALPYAMLAVSGTCCHFVLGCLFAWLLHWPMRAVLGIATLPVANLYTLATACECAARALYTAVFAACAVMLATGDQTRSLADPWPVAVQIFAEPTAALALPPDAVLKLLPPPAVARHALWWESSLNSTWYTDRPSSLYVCGGDQAARAAWSSTQMLSGQLQLASAESFTRMLPRVRATAVAPLQFHFLMTTVQWNRLCRCVTGNTSAHLGPLSSEHVATATRAAVVVDLLRNVRSLVSTEDNAGSAGRTSATTELLRAVSLGGLQQITDRQASDSERDECANAICIIELLQSAHGVAPAVVDAAGRVGAAERVAAVLKQLRAVSCAAAATVVPTTGGEAAERAKAVICLLRSEDGVVTAATLQVKGGAVTADECDDAASIVELMQVQLVFGAAKIAAENATAVDAGASGTASPSSSTARDPAASAAGQPDVLVADTIAEHGTPPSSPPPPMPPSSPLPPSPPLVAGVHACGGDLTISRTPEWTPASLLDNGLNGQQSAAVSSAVRCILSSAAELPELEAPHAAYPDSPPTVDDAASGRTLIENISALGVIDVFNLMQTSLGADDPLTAAQAVYQAQEEGLELVSSSDAASGFANVRLMRDSGRVSRPYKAIHMKSGVRYFIGCYSTPEEAALNVARARAQSILDVPSLPEELNAGPSGSAPPNLPAPCGCSVLPVSQDIPWDCEELPLAYAAELPELDIYPCGGNMSQAMQSGQMLPFPELDRGISDTEAGARTPGLAAVAPNTAALVPAAPTNTDSVIAGQLGDAESNWREIAATCNASLSLPDRHTQVAAVTLQHDSAADTQVAAVTLQHDSAAVPAIRVLPTPVPTAPYAYATALSRPRGLRKTQHLPALLPVSLPADPSGPNASDPGGLLDQRNLAAGQMVRKADKCMDERVLHHLQGLQAMRIDVCAQVLSRSDTLVFGDSMSGFSQVRVLGDPDGSGPLRFQACRILPPTQPGATRTTVSGQIFHLPELAASELAERLITSPPAGAPPIAYGDATLDYQARHALGVATTDGLSLPNDQSMSGYRGVIFNANAGTGRAPKKRPYQARLTEVSSNKRIAHGRYGTAEEAALERAKLLKSNPGRYKY